VSERLGPPAGSAPGRSGLLDLCLLGTTQVSLPFSACAPMCSLPQSVLRLSLFVCPNLPTEVSLADCPGKQRKTGKTNADNGEKAKADHYLRIA